MRTFCRRHTVHSRVALRPRCEIPYVITSSLAGVYVDTKGTSGKAEVQAVL